MAHRETKLDPEERRKLFEEFSRPRRRARQYADVNEQYPPERFDIENFEFTYGNAKYYRIGDKIGEGAYSEVFEAYNRKLKMRCVLKTLRPEKDAKIKIQRELKILSLVQGHPNIVKLYEIIRQSGPAREKQLVFEHVENPDFRVTFYNFDDYEARYYLYQLLLAIDYTHSQGIIHRDIKPRNVLYNPRTRELRLIDWGFGEFYFPGKPIEKWPGTRFYKAPEMFFRYPYYDYAVDMWAFGCILASIVFARMPMFKGKVDSLSQLQEINKALGSGDLHRYLSRYGIPLRSKYRKGLRKRKRRIWEHYINPRHQEMASVEGIDLVDKILIWDHERRWSASEALAHPYFDPVRDDVDARHQMGGSGEYVSYSGYSTEPDQAATATTTTRSSRTSSRRN